jgi:hypothetical protein
MLREREACVAPRTYHVSQELENLNAVVALNLAYCKTCEIPRDRAMHASNGGRRREQSVECC